MPGLRGVELAQAVLELRPDLVVVFVSGYTDRMLGIDSISIEASFLQKPFSLDALARLARSLLDKKRKKGWVVAGRMSDPMEPRKLKVFGNGHHRIHSPSMPPMQN